MPRILGVDPGGAHTGLVLRDGPRLLANRLVSRGDQQIPAYLVQVLDAVQDLWDLDPPPKTPVVIVAVEGLNAPTPHMGLTNVTGLLDAAQVLGAVLACWTAAVVVPPGGHGAVPDVLQALPGKAGDKACRQYLDDTYPAALIGAREKRGAGLLRHCRSAWSIAGAAEMLDRLQKVGI